MYKKWIKALITLKTFLLARIFRIHYKLSAAAKIYSRRFAKNTCSGVFYNLIKAYSCFSKSHSCTIPRQFVTVREPRSAVYSEQRHREGAAPRLEVPRKNFAEKPCECLAAGEPLPQERTFLATQLRV